MRKSIATVSLSGDAGRESRGRRRGARRAGAPTAVAACARPDPWSKYGTPQATLDLWRSLGIMMGRDGDARLLHAYTVPFDKRFFFEIIERRNGDQGYGAGDAPVRLAAQAQWQREQGGAA